MLPQLALPQIEALHLLVESAEHIETNYAAFGSGASVDIDMTSLYLAAVGTITLSKYGDDDEKKVELFGKIGLHSWDWDGTGRGTLTGKDSGDGSDWFYGVGLDFGPQDRKGVVLRLEYEVFPVDTEYTLTTSSGIIEDEIDYEAALVNVSLIWRF